MEIPQAKIHWDQLYLLFFIEAPQEVASSEPPGDKSAIPLHPLRHSVPPAHKQDDEEEDDDEDDEDDDDDVAIQARVEGAYDPSEFDQLAVEGEVRDLFHHIIQYTPQVMDLEYKFR